MSNGGWRECRVEMSAQGMLRNAGTEKPRRAHDSTTGDSDDLFLLFLAVASGNQPP